MKKILIFLVLCLLLFSNAFLIAENQPTIEIMEKYGKAVVLIATADTKDESIGLGSGFLVSPTGVIVTNYHVVEGAYPIIIKLLNGDMYDSISIIDTDPQKDIAIIKVKGWALPVVNLGDSNSAKQGESIVVIGNPQGLENTISDGLLSAIRDTGEGYKLHQITAPISPGSSGSPVFNIRGEVIGIASSSIEEGQNLNFSIPINYVRGMINETPKMTLEEFSKSKPATFSPLPKRIKKVETKEFVKTLIEVTNYYFYGHDNLYYGLYKTTEPHQKGFNARKWGIDTRVYLSVEYLKNGFEKLISIDCDNDGALKIKESYKNGYEKLLEGAEKVLSGLKKCDIRANVEPDMDLVKEGWAIGELSLQYVMSVARELCSLVKVTDIELSKNMLPSYKAVLKFTEDDLKEAPGFGVDCFFSASHYTISEVHPGSPAEKAGIKIFDVILGEYNGSKFPTVVEFCEFMIKHKAGGTVKFEIMRDNKKIVKTVTLTEKPKYNFDSRDVVEESQQEPVKEEWPEKIKGSPVVIVEQEQDKDSKPMEDRGEDRKQKNLNRRSKRK